MDYNTGQISGMFQPFYLKKAGKRLKETAFEDGAAAGHCESHQSLLLKGFHDTVRMEHTSGQTCCGTQAVLYSGKVIPASSLIAVREPVPC